MEVAPLLAEALAALAGGAGVLVLSASFAEPVAAGGTSTTAGGGEDDPDAQAANTALAVRAAARVGTAFPTMGFRRDVPKNMWPLYAAISPRAR